MSLVALTRSPSPPRTPARARLADAATELRRAIADLEREDRERAAERERTWEENRAKIERRARLAAARAATANLRIEVPTRFFWDLGSTAMEALDELSREAKRNGEQGRAQGFDARADQIAKELHRIQERQVRGGAE